MHVSILATAAFLTATIETKDWNLEAVDRVMAERRKLTRTPSVAYAVVRNGKVIHVRAIGDANLETISPAKRETLYEIGSMTKQFTAAGILKLVDEGKVNLDDPISKYLRDLPEGWKKLTIRQCLSHTAGLKDHLVSFSALRTEPVRASDIYAKLGPLKLDFEPGTAWSYSNTGYVVATEIIESVSGETYGKFLKTKVFDPLGMKHTTVSDPDRMIPNRVRGYQLTANGYRNAPVINPTLASGAGNLLSTVDDLARWEAALETGKILKPETMKAFLEPVNLTSGRSSGYSLGWFIKQDQGRPLIEHGGNTVGFSTDIFRIPEENAAVIVLTNAGGLAGAAWARHAVSALLPKYDPDRNVQTDPNPDLTARLSVTFRKWGRGNYDMSNFAPEFINLLGTARGIGVRQGLVGIGRSVKRVRCLQGESAGGKTVNRYRLEFDGAAVLIEMGFDADGRVADFSQLYDYPTPVSR